MHTQQTPSEYDKQTINTEFYIFSLKNCTHNSRPKETQGKRASSINAPYTPVHSLISNLYYMRTVMTRLKPTVLFRGDGGKLHGMREGEENNMLQQRGNVVSPCGSLCAGDKGKKGSDGNAK